MKKVSVFFVALLALALVLGFAGCSNGNDDEVATAAAAGTTVYGTFSGIVRGYDGPPLAGVVVIDSSGSYGARALSGTSVTTDASGYFKIEKLISGDHTIHIGNGVSSTMTIASVHVPTLEELKTAAALPTDASTDVDYSAILKQSEGPYEVQVSDEYNYESIYYLYPCNASISGTAMIQETTDRTNSTAAAAPVGTKIFADFSDWNDGYPLIIDGTVGAAGAFTIANVPAVLNEFSVSYAIDFFLVSEGGATGVNSVTIDGVTSNSSSSTSTTSVTDGALVSGDTRVIDTLVFRVAVTPKIVTYAPTTTTAFDPGTAAAPTPLAFTFDQAMNPAKGSIQVLSTKLTTTDLDLTATIDISWDATFTTLTLAPNNMFEYGRGISVAFTNFESEAGGVFTQTVVYTVAPDFALVSNNVGWEYDNSAIIQEFPVAGNIDLVFNYPISFIDANGTYLRTAAGTYVDIATALSTDLKTLTINPTLSLDNGTTYTIHYSVYAAMANGSDHLAASSLTFATIPRTIALAAPTGVSLDGRRNFALHGARNSANFDDGDDELWILYDKVTDAENYYLQYKLASESVWQTYGTALKTTTVAASYETSTYCSSDIDMTLLAAGYQGLESGKPMDLRIQVTASSGLTLPALAYSASVPLEDLTAPNVGTMTLASTRTSGNPNNATGTSPYAIYTITRTPTEPLQDPVAGDVTVTGATVYSIGLTSAGSIEIVFAIANGTDATGNAVSLRVYDKAGNQYDDDVGTAGPQNFAFTLN